MSFGLIIALIESLIEIRSPFLALISTVSLSKSRGLSLHSVYKCQEPAYLVTPELTTKVSLVIGNICLISSFVFLFFIYAITYLLKSLNSSGKEKTSSSSLFSH